MQRVFIGVLFLTYYSSIHAQVLTDSIQKILKRTESQINLYSLNPNSFSSLAGITIYKDLQLLKSVYAYKNETLGYHKKVDFIDSSYKSLLVSKPYIHDVSDKTQPMATQLEKIFEKREAELLNLKIENHHLKNQVNLLVIDTVRLCEKLRNSKTIEIKYMNDNKMLGEKLKLLEHGTYWGLSLGFNYFINNPPTYFINYDSTIGVLGSPKGISFLISGIIGYKFHRCHSFIFNIPLGDFTSNSASAIGLFNQKLDGGLGYGYHISGVSIIAIINISPYEKLAPELLDGKKIEGKPYSRFKLEDYPTTTSYSPSITIGMSYNFLRKPGLNSTLPE